MAEPIFVYVDRKALRELVDYADLMRSYVDQDHVCSSSEQDSSDAEFRAKVQALGTPGLLPDEDGNG
jgi:hypothetical protein